MPKNIGDLGKSIAAKGLKTCQKSNKLPNLVTLNPCSTIVLIKYLIDNHAAKITLIVQIAFNPSTHPRSGVHDDKNKLDIRGLLSRPLASYIYNRLRSRSQEKIPKINQVPLILNT